jgi:DNA-binding CsgD family transcriptional regulator
MAGNLDIDKLRKVAALMDSPSEGERSAAMERTRKMLAAAGKSFRDLPELLALRPSAPTFAPSAGPIFNWEDISRKVDDDMERAHPGYKAEQARQRAERAQQRAIFKVDIIRKYGSEEAILVDDERQAAIEAAVAPFKRVEPKTFANGVFDWETLDGWSDGISETIPEQVARAIREALPFPNTIDALETGLRARSLEEIEIRLRHMIDRQYSMPEVDQAVLLDLQNLIAENAANGHHSATERRAEVEGMLSNSDTAALSDREIARRVGVSPQTVGNIRRRVSQRTAAAVGDLFA